MQGQRSLMTTVLPLYQEEPIATQMNQRTGCIFLSILCVKKREGRLKTETTVHL